MTRGLPDPTAALSPFAVFDGGSPPLLDGLCRGLLESQKQTWQDLGDSYRSVLARRQREVACEGFSARIEVNAGRMKSTVADVRTQAVRERPCFLCPENLPEPQKPILYRGEYLILCNPMPVFPGHLTISHVRHLPQAVAGGRVATLLDLVADLGRGWTVLYNGPRCGASAPDHLHFQAIPSGRLPIEEEVAETSRFERLATRGEALVARGKGLGREVVLFEGVHPRSASLAFERYLRALSRVLGTRDEPMINITAFHRAGRLCLAVFPRRAHRPAAFFAEGEARLVVSPAVIEMAGVIVTPVERDFERLDGRTVESIYREVSLEPETGARVIEEMGSDVISDL